MIKQLKERLCRDARNLQRRSEVEPELRVVGLFSTIEEEKIAEIIHAMLYMNEMNKSEKSELKREIKYTILSFHIWWFGR